MANTQIPHVFQGDKWQFLRFPRIQLPGMEADFPKIGQPVIIYPIVAGVPWYPRPDCRPRTRNQTVSNRSMTSVSASPARVHSWNAGNDIIAS